jgi:flagellar hook-associated protein 1 FlgK
MQQVAADPASLPARQTLVSSSESLVARFRSIEQRLSEQYAGLNEQIASRVDHVNSLSQQIAEVNQRIISAQAATGQPANDLLDQRDSLVTELNTEMRVSTIEQSDGSFAVFAGNGQQLVIGTQFSTLQAKPSAADPERFTISLVTGASTQELPESIFSAGAIGGLLRFRREALDLTANALGRVSTSMALTFNAQHALGQDLLGNSAGSAAFAADFFQLGSPKVIANSQNTGTPAIAASFIDPPPLRFNNGDFSVTFDGTNYEVVSQKYGIAPGTVVAPTLEQALRATDLLANVPAIDPATANFFTNLTTSDYRVVFSTATNYAVTRLSDNSVVAAGTAGGGAISFDGLSLNIGTAAAAGDSFLIEPTRESARNIGLNTSISSDPRLIAAGLPVRSALSTTNTGSGKIDITAVAPGFDAPATGSPILISANGNQLTITGTTSANITVTSGGATVAATAGVPFAYTPDAVITVDGLSFTISGQPKTGDTFTVLRNTNGISDARNALLLGKLQSQDTMAGGTTSFQGAYSQLVSSVGNKTREIQVTGEAQKALFEQAVAAREAFSGVNLDEEAANLIRYQQAYQAAARVIDVGSRLFDTLLQMGI